MKFLTFCGCNNHFSENNCFLDGVRLSSLTAVVQFDLGLKG